jgi:hypothetical protein
MTTEQTAASRVLFVSLCVAIAIVMSGISQIAYPMSWIDGHLYLLLTSWPNLFERAYVFVSHVASGFCVQGELEKER